jgi:hypothetical protein
MVLVVGCACSDASKGASGRQESGIDGTTKV